VAKVCFSEISNTEFTIFKRTQSGCVPKVS